MSKAFSEKLMLAVTRVNGCRYCNYFHTKSAIAAGVSHEEVRAMLDGEFGDVDEEELVALLFAQHYADTDADPDRLVYDRFVACYGKRKARYILASIKLIMIGNIQGIALDALQSRIRGRKMPDSKLRHELGNVFGLIVLLPAAIVHNGIEWLFGKRNHV